MRNESALGCLQQAIRGGKCSRSLRCSLSQHALMLVQRQQVYSCLTCQIAMKLQYPAERACPWIELIKSNSSGNHVQLRTVRDYGVCSRQVLWRRRLCLSDGTWPGSAHALLTLLFVANWFQPQSLAEPAAHEINRPVIRIASMQQPPERIVIDTNLPTIVPPPTLTAHAIPDEPLPQVQSHVPITSHTTATGAEKRKPKGQEEADERGCSQSPAIGTNNCGRE